MKRLIPFTFLIVIIITSNLMGQWDILNEWEFSSGRRQRLYSIFFINNDVGWIARYGTLLKTVDGGQNWKSMSTGEIQRIEDIYFIDESIGWGIGVYHNQIEDEYKGIIIKSTDGGQTWIIQKERSEFNLDEIYAFNENIVYIVGGSSVLKTSDGGENWIDVSPYSTDVEYHSAWFNNSEIGYVSGLKNPLLRTGIVFKTIDGGSTWNEIKISEFEEIYNLQFINESTGYFLARDIEKSSLCVSTDTLKTWTILESNVQSFFALDTDIVFAIIADSLSISVMKSTNGGLTWVQKESLSSNVNQLYFKNADNGFIISNLFRNPGGIGRGTQLLPTLWRSLDEGNTWYIQKFSAPLTDVLLIDHSRILVGCTWLATGGHHTYETGGIIYETHDNGETWQINAELNSQVIASYFLNKQIGFILGNDSNWNGRNWWDEGGFIFKTTNSGDNWEEIYPPDDSLEYIFEGRDIFFMNENIGWAAGRGNWAEDSSGAEILGTADGGQNWDLIWKYPNIDINSHYELNSIQAIGTEAWAVGKHGMLLKYTEKDLWQVQNSITDLPLNKVFFSDEQHGWIAGGYFNDNDVQLILLKTIDSGETWQETTDFNYEIKDMFFEDSLHGWVVGNDTSRIEDGNGVILTTSDGGDNWSAQVEDLSAPLTALHFKDGHGWAVGGNGLVLRTEDGLSWVDQNTGKIYPDKFSMSQNYPNPFNPRTIINYELPTTLIVDLSIYNLLGQKVVTLVSARQKAGHHQVEWNASGFASGIYYYKIKAGEFQDVKKMILLR